MSSPQKIGRSNCVALLAGIALVGCGSATPTPSQPAVVEVASPTTSAAPTPSPVLSPSPSPSASMSASAIVHADPLVADLTGVTTDPKLAHRLPLAVLIDDNRIARPQSGFNSTSVVYQAPADGGETRYMFVFQEGDTAQIGPVRSARYYFVDWASEMRAVIAHYGGERRSRAHLTAFDGLRFTDVDALGRGARAYHRIASRKAPHNGYTSTSALRTMSVKLGAPPSAPADLYRRTFVAPADAGSLPASQHIRIPYRTGLVEYRFDRTSDRYRRVLDGKAQVDPADGKSVTTRNVVILFMSYRIDTKVESGHSRPLIGAIGSGRALVFREGRRVEGIWSKADETAPTRLLDAAGNEIPLLTGRTFFQIVPTGTKVSVGS